ncbi:MAG TPA: sigma-70 family RNA polymerase sigma factor [Thermoanaerobaculia bacterium]
MQEPRREATHETSVRPDPPSDAPEAFEEAYLQFAPLLRKIAIGKFRIPPADAESLVHDVFATYFTNAQEVHEVGPYLVGGICNASRQYRRRTDAANELFCGESPCAAAPAEPMVREVERRILLGRMLARIGSRCREILEQYYVNGESTDAIAQRLRFKATTVHILLHKCRKRALLAYHAMERHR